MNRTYIYFFTRSTDPSQPSLFFSLLRDCLPRAIPKEFHTYQDEPVSFTEAHIGDFVDGWWDGMFYWKSVRPEIAGHMFLGSTNYHSGILHLFDTTLADETSCREFLIDGACLLRADYAFAHVLGEPPFSAEDKVINAARGGDLQLWLPPVPWAACYGKPYLDLFGREKLLSLPVQESREVESEIIYCQLTSRLLDPVENKQMIQGCREAVYQHLGQNAFFDPRNPDEQGRVPAFQKPIVVRPNRS
jgi:hypothetical protein